MTNGWWHPFAHGVNGVSQVARVGYRQPAATDRRPRDGRTSQRGERVR
jgi:hypothetical protein